MQTIKMEDAGQWTSPVTSHRWYRLVDGSTDFDKSMFQHCLRDVVPLPPQPLRKDDSIRNDFIPLLRQVMAVHNINLEVVDENGEQLTS